MSDSRIGARHHYLDWLRNLAILYLFPFHTARAFDLGEPYYVEGEPGAVTTGLITVSYWFMPLLFLLAGMASVFALRRRSAREYAGERVRRLLVPLLFGVVVLVPPQAYLGLLFHTGAAPSYLEFLSGYFVDWSDLSGYFGTFTPGQLWFIAFLVVISLALLPAMTALARQGTGATWLRHPLALFALPTIGLLALSALPSISGKNVVWYAGYFLLGYLVAGDDAVLDTIVRIRRIALIGALLGAAAVLVEQAVIGRQHGLSAIGIVFGAGHELACWLAVLAILGYGRHLLNRPSRAMSYLNHAAYPVFVLHQTVLVAVGFWVLDAVGGTPLQFALIAGGSLVATFALYEAVRRIPGAAFLLGTARRGSVDREPARLSPS